MFKEHDLVHVSETNIPAIAVYRKAATIQKPAHRYETKKPHGRTAPAALDSLKALAIEIFPEWLADIEQLTPEIVKNLSHKELDNIA